MKTGIPLASVYRSTMLTPQPISREAAPANGFGIYLHAPYCVHKCSYCDFYSFAAAAPDFERLAAGLAREIAEAGSWLDREGGRPLVGSIFFGGGTPSLVPTPLLGRVFAAIAESFALAPDAEITLEANPETVNDAFLDGLRRHTPVNRVSLGAQSFRPDLLRKLERLGSRESIVAAVEKLRRHGYDNFNLDLIFAIPGQGEQGTLADIDEAISLGPAHLSFYNLTLKPGHPLYRDLPDDDTAADLYETGVARLAAAGYEQYEISNFSRAGRPSRHNLLYWNGGDYLGVGPSAASRFFRDGRFLHRKQVADVGRWLQAVERGDAFPAPGLEPTTAEQTVLEATFLELRRNEGIVRADFARRYGYDPGSSPKYPMFLRQGLLEETAGRLRLTARGRLLADAVTRELAP